MSEINQIEGSGMRRNDGEQRARDPRTTRDLIQIALSEADEHAAWEPVTIMHFRANREDFEAARALCGSADVRERRLGAYILSQMGIPARIYAQEAIPILHAMLDGEDDAETLHAIIIALGYQDDPRIVPTITPFEGHPDADVRYSVAFALGGYDDDAAIAALIRLSSDPAAQVRDWATFALGSLSDRNDTAIRAALIARLDDSDDQTREEAHAGLAQREEAKASQSP